MRKTFVVILFAIMIGIGSYYWFVKRIDNIRVGNEYRQIAQEENSKLLELNKRKEELYSEIEEAKKGFVIEGMGSSIVLISDTDSRAKQDIIPLMKEYGYHGVVAIDDKLGAEGHLTIEDIEELVSKGFEAVISINRNTNIKEMYDLYSKSFNIMGYFCPNKDITSSQIKDIKESNIKNVIIYSSTVDDPEIFSISSVGSYDKNSKTVFDDAIANSSIVAYQVGYEKSYDNYIQNNCESMLNRMEKAKSLGKTEITNISEALQRHDLYLEELNSSKYDHVRAKIQELETELDTVTKQILNH